MTVLGAAAVAVVTLLAPLSRGRLVAAWVLLGTAVAAVVIAGPNERMYPAYAVVLVQVIAAWLSSRRVSAAPRMSVWRKGTGRGEEHVPVVRQEVAAGRDALAVAHLERLARAGAQDEDAVARDPERGSTALEDQAVAAGTPVRLGVLALLRELPQAREVLLLRIDQLVGRPRGREGQARIRGGDRTRALRVALGRAVPGAG